jgi:hypothetical protein
VLDTIAFAVLLFSVVKSAQPYFENEPEKLNRITLLHFLVFMLDFVSIWFKTYSVYLAGERKEQTTTEIQNAVTSLWDCRFSRVSCILMSECFFLYEFIDLNFDNFLQLATLLPLKQASEEGETLLTDLTDMQDLM